MGLLTRNRKQTETPPDAVIEKLGGGARNKRVGEMAVSALRTGVRSFTRTFWPTQPSFTNTKISYSKTRSLYRNDDSKNNLGAGFSRRIINANVDFIDLPYAATGDEVVDEFLNNCIWTYWADALMTMFRDATRDAETVVRIRRDIPENPLVSAEEWEACYLEIIPPERVSIYYKERGGRKEIDRAYVRHEVEMIVEEREIAGRAFRQPQTRKHVIIEEITESQYRYWDETEGEWLEEWTDANGWNFVPLVECANEPEAYLEGGQSDLEAPLPFILAFHDVMAQTLQAHKAHSVPKVNFKVNDVMSFIQNNWPESFEQDGRGQPIPGTFNGEISWKGTEIIFTGAEEGADYLQATPVLGDSKTLMEWLLECISITSETPKSILMNATSADSDEMTPLARKINRKRRFFQDPIQRICRMVLAINFMEPLRVPLAWDEITPQMALQKAEALQQNVMSLEVLATRKVISDRTVRQHVKPLIPSMKGNDAESKDAQDNEEIPVTSPNSLSGSDSGANE